MMTTLTLLALLNIACALGNLWFTRKAMQERKRNAAESARLLAWSRDNLADAERNAEHARKNAEIACSNFEAASKNSARSRSLFAIAIRLGLVADVLSGREKLPYPPSKGTTL